MYRIEGLGSLTGADGVYQFSVDASGIAVSAGNVGNGTRSISWVVDSTGAFLDALISGFLFEDHNTDGLIGAGGQGLGGWTAFLETNSNGTFESEVEASTVTDSDGRYAFTGLTAEEHRIGVVPEGGWTLSLPIAGNGIYEVNPSRGENTLGIDFGFFVGADIRGEIYHDVNENSVKDSGDQPLSGWTAFLDDNINGVRDAEEPYAISAADGSYVISGVRPGSHVVTIELQSGWRQTAPEGNAGQSSEIRSALNSKTETNSVEIIESMNCSCSVPDATSWSSPSVDLDAGS